MLLLSGVITTDGRGQYFSLRPFTTQSGRASPAMGFRLKAEPGRAWPRTPSHFGFLCSMFAGPNSPCLRLGVMILFLRFCCGSIGLYSFHCRAEVAVE